MDHIEGEIVEFTLDGVRHTAEVMLHTEDGMVLLDFFDNERPVLARVDQLIDLVVFRPDPLAA